MRFFSRERKRESETPNLDAYYREMVEDCKHLLQDSRCRNPAWKANLDNILFRVQKSEAIIKGGGKIVWGDNLHWETLWKQINALKLMKKEK